jgi:hypothetical protein
MRRSRVQIPEVAHRFWVQAPKTDEQSRDLGGAKRRFPEVALMKSLLAIHQSLVSIRALEGWGGETIAPSDWVDGSLRWLE